MLKKEIKKLDELWSLAVKGLANYVCEHCGIRGVRMEAAHVVGRRHRGTRWGMELTPASKGDSPDYDLCGHCLCHKCHQQYDEHGPLEKDIVAMTIGKERKERIQIAATRQVTKYQDFDVIKEFLEGVMNVDNPVS